MEIYSTSASKKLLLTGVVLALSGCANSGFFYAVNSEAELDFYSRVYYSSRVCKDAGLFNEETAARGMAFATKNIYRQSSSQAQAKVKALVEARIPASQLDCSGLATRILADSYSTPQPIAPQPYIPRTTNCSTAFGQTNCTTY